jgi:hypothetical protein
MGMCKEISRKIAFKANFDTSEVDEAIETVERLCELLKEAKSLVDDLTSCLQIKISVSQK